MLFLWYILFGLFIPIGIVLFLSRKDIIKYKKNIEEQDKQKKEHEEEKNYRDKGFFKLSDLKTAEDRAQFKKFFESKYKEFFIVEGQFYNFREEFEQGAIYKKIYNQWNQCHEKYYILEREFSDCFGPSMAYDRFMGILNNAIHEVDLNMVKTINDMMVNAGIDLNQLYEENKEFLEAFTAVIKSYIESGLGQGEPSETESALQELMKVITEISLYKE